MFICLNYSGHYLEMDRIIHDERHSLQIIASILAVDSQHFLLWVYSVGGVTDVWGEVTHQYFATFGEECGHKQLRNEEAPHFIYAATNSGEGQFRS